MSDAAIPGLKALFIGRMGAYMATFSLGSALYAFSAFLVAACMPSAVEVLGHLDLLSWGFTFYLIAAIVAGTVAWPLKRRFGTASALHWASGMFLAGTLACGFAPDIWLLLAGRVFQGMGEGAISGLIYMLIPEVFPALLIPAIFGVEAAIWASGSTIGPILGGFLTEALSWRAAFLVEVPMVLVFMLLVAVTVPRRETSRPAEARPAEARPAEARPAERLPLARLLGVGLGILLLSLGAIEPQLWAKAASVVLAVALLAWLVRRDAAAPNRLLPRGAFSGSAALGLAFWVVLLMPAANTGPTTYAILMLERIWGFGPLTASILGAASYITWSVVGIAVSWLPPRFGPTCLWLGPLALALGLLIGIVAMPGPSLVLLLASLILAGIGYGLSWGFLSHTIMTGGEAADRDRASAMLPAVLSTGLAIGAALGGLTANAAGLAEHSSPAMVARAGLFCFVVATVIGLGCFIASLRLGRLAKPPGG